MKSSASEPGLRLPLNFLSNGFRSRLDYQRVFGKMNPHSSVNLLEQIFKQWNTHLDKQTLESQNNLFGLWKNKICKICFASHVFACLEMNIGETCSVFRSCLALDRKSPERGNVANVFGQRSWFRESLLDKQHGFNGTSLEVNKIWQIKL